MTTPAIPEEHIVDGNKSEREREREKKEREREKAYGMIRRGDVGEQEDKCSHAPSPLLQQSQVGPLLQREQVACRIKKRICVGNTFWICVGQDILLQQASPTDMCWARHSASYVLANTFCTRS